MLLELLVDGGDGVSMLLAFCLELPDDAGEVGAGGFGHGGAPENSVFAEVIHFLHDKANCEH